MFQSIPCETISTAFVLSGESLEGLAWTLETCSSKARNREENGSSLRGFNGWTQRELRLHTCAVRHGTVHVVCWCRQQLPSLLGKLWFAHRTILSTLGLYANHSRGKYIFKGILYVGNEEEICSKSKPARKIVSLASDKETLLRQHLLSCQHQNRLVIIQGKKKGCIDSQPWL